MNNLFNSCWNTSISQYFFLKDLPNILNIFWNIFSSVGRTHCQFQSSHSYVKTKRCKKSFFSSDMIDYDYESSWKLEKGPSCSMDKLIENPRLSFAKKLGIKNLLIIIMNSSWDFLYAIEVGDATLFALRVAPLEKELRHSGSPLHAPPNLATTSFRILIVKYNSFSFSRKKEMLFRYPLLKTISVSQKSVSRLRFSRTVASISSVLIFYFNFSRLQSYTFY